MTLFRGKDSTSVVSSVKIRSPSCSVSCTWKCIHAWSVLCWWFTTLWWCNGSIYMTLYITCTHVVGIQQSDWMLYPSRPICLHHPPLSHGVSTGKRSSGPHAHNNHDICTCTCAYLNNPLGVLQDEVNVFPSQVLEVPNGGPHPRERLNGSLAELTQQLQCYNVKETIILRLDN